MTLGQKQEKFARNIAKLLQFAFEKGYEVRLQEFMRTLDQQKLYVQQGKSKTMASKHVDKLAGDIYFTKGGVLLQTKKEVQPLGDYWESLDKDNQWGGNWAFLDVPHFQG